MNQYRSRLFLAISSVALLFVLIIQIRWLVETENIKEEIFNEKANMVVAKTADALSTDPQACRSLEEGDGRNGIQKTDSLVSNYLSQYNMKVGYEFRINSPSDSKLNVGKSAVYSQRVNENATKNGLELSVFLPGKKQFIVRDMSSMLVASIILILIVFVMFWKTAVALINERKISRHTVEFLNNMTHEFKTPLTNISLASQMISKNIRNNDFTSLNRYTGIIDTENDKLQKQVEQVLSMASLERNDLTLQFSTIDIHELLTETVKNFSVQTACKDGMIRLDLRAQHAVIPGDSVHLSGVFANLLDNAVKYSIEKPVIEVETYNEGEMLIVKIKDQGIGIDKIYHSQIFDKFFRIPTGDLHEVKGFGLGLAYVKKIADLHKATIDVSSEKGKGSTFTISFNG